MYIWKTKNLAHDLKSNIPSQEEYKKYYVATAIITLIGFYLSMLEPPLFSEPVIFEGICSIIITVIGINIIFTTNGGNNGTSFLNRAISLTLPLMFKVMAASIIFTIALEVVRELGYSALVISWLFSVFIVLIQIVVFWRINVHIKYINA